MDFAQNTTTTLASSSTTVFLLVEIIALVITAGAIAAGVMQNKFYKYVPPVALIFTATALGVEDHLARKIESVAPNIGDDMVSTQRGCGSLNPFLPITFSQSIPSPPPLLYYLGTNFVSFTSFFFRVCSNSFYL